MKSKRKARTAILITGAAAVLLLTACPGDIDPTGSQNIRVAGAIESEVYQEGEIGVASISGPSFDVAPPAFSIRHFEMDSDQSVLVFLASNENDTPVAVGTQGDNEFTFVVEPGAEAKLVEADQLPSGGRGVESDPEARFDEVTLYVGEEHGYWWVWDLRSGAIIDDGNGVVIARYIYADRATTVSGGRFGDGVELSAGWNVVYFTYEGSWGDTVSANTDPAPGASFDWVVYSLLQS